MSQSGLVIGIDGGGTKTIAWLAATGPGDPKILGRGSAGPSNPCAVGFERARSSLEAVLDAAFRDAGQPRQTTDAACLALAGTDNKAQGREIVDWLENEQFARHVLLTNDAEPILACASPDSCGVGLIAGTGSFVLGRNPGGKTVRVGGWGYRIGDEGSGYAIAVAGLRAAAHAADGRGSPTILLERYMQHFQVGQPRLLIERIYGEDQTNGAIAATAKLVFTAAVGDPVAERIVSEAAESLAAMVLAAQCQLSLPAEFPLAVTGGAVLGSPLLKNKLLEQLANQSVRPSPLTEVTDPVRGAVVLAQRAVGEGEGNDFQQPNV